MGWEGNCLKESGPSIKSSMTMQVPRSVRVNGELSEGFKDEVGVRQGCVMFSIYKDGCIREMKSEYGI